MDQRLVPRGYKGRGVLRVSCKKFIQNDSSTIEYIGLLYGKQTIQIKKRLSIHLQYCK